MLLEVKNLTAGYAATEVLRNVSLRVEAGEAVALIGPNGAGKSTLLKSIMGLTTKKGGAIFYRDEEITRRPTHSLLKAGIGFVPQGRLAFPSLTVQENLEMGGYLLNQAEVLKKNLHDVFGRFPVLQQKRDERAGSLSGGEQQLLAIGRALMTSPKLLLLDEPSLGLAPLVVREIFGKLAELNALGTALLIVEQNVRLVLKYVQRGYLLASGTVKFAGSAEELGDEKLMTAAYLR